MKSFLTHHLFKLAEYAVSYSKKDTQKSHHMIHFTGKSIKERLKSTMLWRKLGILLLQLLGVLGKRAFPSKEEQSGGTVVCTLNIM
jgi:hypothetical protein